MVFCVICISLFAIEACTNNQQTNCTTDRPKLQNSFPSDKTSHVNSQVNGKNTFSMDENGEEFVQRRVDLVYYLPNVNVDHLNRCHLLQN